MKQMNDDLRNDESDEYLLRVSNQLIDELQDIKVSEELIARTLDKVKENQETRLYSSSSDQKIKRKEDTKALTLRRKSHLRWVTTLAGVAAACLVLMIGSKVLFQGYSSKDSSKAESSNDYKDAATESSTLTEGSEPMFGASSEKLADKESVQGGTSSDITVQDSMTNNENMLEDIDEKSEAGGTSTEESPKFTITTNEKGKMKEITGMSATAYEDAVLIGAKEDQVYVYQKSDSETQAQALLELLSSEAMKLSTQEATDTWNSYIILSMEDDSAILYRIGNNDQVVANIYGSTGKSNDVVYQVEDMKQFDESLEFILNEGK